jgi:prophage antirepressor-like protein
MSTVDEIITKINELVKMKYVKKNDVTFIQDNLENIKEYTTNEEAKYIDTIIKVISKPKIKSDERNKMKQIKSNVINILKKYEEEYNDQDNEDDVEDELTVDEIEKKLDDKIPDYNCFNENHPMNNVNYTNNDTWRYKNNSNDKKTKNFNTIIEYAKEKNIPQKSENFGKIWKKHFCYRNHYFVSYWKNNEPYFDIQHIISVLNLKKSSWNDKYNEYNDDIKYYIWHKNEFGGFILRELINEKTVYEIILSSNSEISKSFKKDISKILADLRKEGQIEISNEKIVKKKKRNITNEENILDNKIYEPIYSYDNLLHVQYIQHLIFLGSQIPLGKYLNKHILYAFFIPINVNHKDIIIKFGYT